MALRLMLIAAGGAVGSLLRYWTSTTVYQVTGTGFPYGTLTVNVLGSLLIGVLYVVLVERSMFAPEWRAALLIGLLGAFTTFSTFSLETLNLIEQGALSKAALNVVVSVMFCLGATWLGILGGRQL